MMHSSPLRILVFHGPQDIYTHELLAWLRGPDVQLDARTVEDMAPNTSGSVDQRVATAIQWADKAIALVTPDSRSPCGAPNVIDEVGRWRGTGRSESLAIVKHQTIDGYSNLDGIVRIEFSLRVNETFIQLSKFLGLLPFTQRARQLNPIAIQQVLNAWQSQYSSSRRAIYIVVGGCQKYDAKRQSLGLKEYQSTAPITGVVRVALALAQAGSPPIDAICDYELASRQADFKNVDLIIVGGGDTNRVSKEIFVHNTSKLPLRFEPPTSSEVLISKDSRSWARPTYGAIIALEGPLLGMQYVIICAGNGAEGTNAALTTVATWLGNRMMNSAPYSQAVGVVVESTPNIEPTVCWTSGA